MTSNPPSPLVIGLADAAASRLPDVERHTLAGHPLLVALPTSYARRKRRRYPLVAVAEASSCCGSLIEMSRLMAQTKEIGETVLVLIDTPLRDAGFVRGQLLPWCAERFRVAPADVVMLDTEQSASVPAMVSALRKALATGTEYGSNVLALQKPLAVNLLRLLSPLLGRLSREAPQPVRDGGRHLLHSAILDRDYEIFVSLPASAASDPARRYPALLALDANIEFSTVAEAAARMAAAGQIEELIVVGIGTPRSEGAMRFGLRRFEEFAPPAEGYAFDDALGRIFRSMFYVAGADAREAVGEAPRLLRFIAKELLPRLARQLPIDVGELGLLGHSAGGTFVGYALHDADSPFKHYVGISPGLGISRDWLMRQDGPVAKKAARVALSLGSLELGNAFNRIAGIHQTEAFAQRLRERHPQLAIDFRCFDGETHSSVFPSALQQGLTFAYGRAGAKP